MKIKKIILLAMMAAISLLSYSQVSRYWIGGGTAHFTDGSKWALTSGGPPIGGTISWANNDIARFDANSGSPTVNYSSTTDVGKLQISGSITVTLKNTHSLNRSFRIRASASDAFTLASASTLVIAGDSKNTTLLMYNTSGVTANIAGTVKVTTGTGGGIGKFEKGSSATINFNSGSYYQHDVNSDALPEANWHATSTCAITGITSGGPSKMDQSFGHFIWNCPGQTNDIAVNDSFTVKGNFTVTSTGSYHLRISTTTSRTLNINGNYLLSAGTFILSRSGASSTMNVNGDFTVNGGTFYISQGGGLNHLNIDGNYSLNNNRTFWMSSGSGYTNLNVKSHFTMSGDVRQEVNNPGNASINFNGTSTQIFTRYYGIFYYGINFTVKSTSTFDMGTSVLGMYSSGNFTLESGATLCTAHHQGITQSGASGCIQVYGTRTFPSGANYNFYRNGPQESGNGLPATLNGVLTIGSPGTSTHLTLPAGVRTINNKLVLVSSGSGNSSIASGTIAYGTSGTLEYQGASAQTAANAEFPSANGPRTVIINNPHGVSLHASRTILTALNLQQGQFSIGDNTLTLNGTVNQTSGSWFGGLGSNLAMGGTGASTNLPAIELNNLTIHRASGIGLNGNVTVHGAVSMTAGNLSANGFQVIYEPGAALLYNGTTQQTTGNAEFPANNGPSALIIENPTQVNLHANRTVSGTIHLQNGIFSIGNFTLSLPGYFQQNAGSLSSEASGHLVFEENSLPAIFPSATILAKLTVNRSGGVNMTGPATVNSNLNLSNGIFSIGTNHLIINGGIAKTLGALVGGDFSSITFGGSGTPTGLYQITLQSLTISRQMGINMLGNVTVKNLLNLISGPLSIGSNTMFIDGSINTLAGFLQGGVNATMIIGENFFLWQPFDLPTVELGTLVSHRAQGVNMLGNVSVHNLLHLVNGNFHIGPHDLAINGDVQQDSGWLTSDQSSGLFVGGAAPTFLSELNQLRKLELNRPQGIMLNSKLEIFDCVNLINGAIDLNGFALTYEPGCTLRYLGLAPQTTSDGEFPAISSPEDVEVMNFQGVSLHDNRIIEGDLRIFTGHFAIGTNTLTLNGNLFNPFFEGGLTGSPESNLIIGEGNPPGNAIFLNSIVLNNLSLHRATGIVLNGNHDTYGSVNLENGTLDLRFHKLTLRKPLSGNPDNLHASPQSTIELSGSAPGMNIGPEDNIRISVVGSLIMSNTHEDGIKLNTDFEIMNQLSVRSNSIFIVSPGRHLTVNDSVLITP